MQTSGIFDGIDRTGFMNSFIWDVELTGMNDVDIENWLKRNGTAPPPGPIRARTVAAGYEIGAVYHRMGAPWLSD